MRLYRHHSNLPKDARGAVLAIGNFDGVHLGHQAVIAEARRVAEASGRPFGVLTFEPHPRQVFRVDDPPFRLTSLRTKTRVMATLGLDLLFVLRFRPALFTLPAETFVERILLQGLGVTHVIVGDNFHFGAKRGGTPALLQEMGAKLGFGVTLMSRVESEGHAISSTEVRQLIGQGDLRAAASLLGRTWEIGGRVLHGAKRGRQLGMPTANIDLGRMLQPAFGVYAVHAALDDSAEPAWHPAVANLGISPMFAYDRPLLEVHLFDFSGDLYDRQLRVALVERLRPEMTFDGLPALSRQMQADGAEARRVLASEEEAAIPMVQRAEGD